MRQLDRLKLRLHPRRKESQSQMIGLESVQPSRSTAVLKGKRKKQTSILVDNIPETSDLERQETFSTCRTSSRRRAAEDQPKVSAPPASKRRRYVYHIITSGLCSPKLLGPLKASGSCLIQSPLSITTLKAITSKRTESQFWRRVQRISVCIVSMFLFNDFILLIACPFESSHPIISLPLTRLPFIARPLK